MKFINNNFIFVAKVKKKNQAFLHLLKWKDPKASWIRHQTPFKNGVSRELCLFQTSCPPSSDENRGSVLATAL